MKYSDALAQFRDAIRAAGMKPPDFIEPGKFYRFPGSDKCKGNTAGWCILFKDGLGGCFGDWSTGLDEVWHAKLDRPLSRSERAAYASNVEEAGKRIVEERQRRYSEAAKKAALIWEDAIPATDDYPYLIKKGIKANGARLHNGALVIPIWLDGKLLSLQFIAPDGGKRFVKGGRTAGGYYCLGKAEDAEIVCITEGFSTAASIREATGHPAIVAFTAGNLEPVAKTMRQKFPELPIVICADDDTDTKGNPGVTNAKKAAQTIGAKVAVPDFGNPRPEGVTDFNDMAALLGFDAVKQAINAAMEPARNVEVDESGWPDLVPLDAPNLPRLDLAHLPDWAGDFARAIAADTETPPELAAGMVLVACAVPAARRLRVLVKPGYFEPCNLWAVVALPSGNRKSAAQCSATAPLMDWERDQATRMEEEIKRITSEHKTMEARAKEIRNRVAKAKDANDAKVLAQEVADIEADLPVIPAPPQVWTSDATPERLGAMLAEHGECMAWLSSEGGIFDLLQGRYSNGIPNLDLVLKAHSGDPERVDRGSRPSVYLRSPRLSIGLSPQPDVFKRVGQQARISGQGSAGPLSLLAAAFATWVSHSPIQSRTG